MSKDDKHNHHYLPKFYLKHWANKQNKVWVYQIHILDGNRFPNPNPLHINNVCSEYHLLSIGDDISIENWAGRNIENHCAPVFKKIVRQEPLNQDDIFYTKSFLALTMARHPLLKESSKIIYNFISRNVEPLNPLAQTVRLRMKVNLEELNQLSLQILHIPNEIDAFFISSDFPAFIVGDLVKETIGDYEIKRPIFTHAWFPTSPKTLAFLSRATTPFGYEETTDISRVKNINAEIAFCAKDILIANKFSVFKNIQISQTTDGLIEVD